MKKEIIVCKILDLLNSKKLRWDETYLIYRAARKALTKNYIENKENNES